MSLGVASAMGPPRIASERGPASDLIAANLAADMHRLTAPPTRRTASIARNTAMFSLLTGASRIMGLVREMLAARYFGTGAPMSAFTLAYAIPSVVRSLFADSALSAAFVPTFAATLETGRSREAYRLASSLLLIMLTALGSITALFLVAAPVVVPALPLGHLASGHLASLAVGLSRVLFPIVLILGLNGLVVGILQAYDHFSIPAISAVVWNVVIIVVMTAGRSLLSGSNQLYAYAAGILAGTTVQFAMVIPMLRRIGFHMTWRTDWRDRRVRRVFSLMLPVSLGLGLINFNGLANSILGAQVSAQAPSAIDRAFRLYMLPQGMFSVAITTVLFPRLSRLAARRDVEALRTTCGTGLRLIGVTLLPAAAATIVLATPITRLVYQGGAFDTASTQLVSTALLWFSFSLPFSGANLLLTRAFFGLQRPWLVMRLSVANLVVNIGVSILLLPLGIAGIVVGTAVADAAMAAAQIFALRAELDGRLDLRRTGAALGRALVATACFGVATYGAWAGLERLFDGSVVAQGVAIGGALGIGAAVYGLVGRWLGLYEVQRAQAMLAGRLRRTWQRMHRGWVARHR